MIITRTPYGISMFGDETGLPSWYLTNSGAVVSLVIDKYCYINLRELPPFFHNQFRLSYSKIELADSPEDILQFLDGRKIGTRLLFGGNLLRQPAFIGTPRRVHGERTNTDFVINDTFWIGVWPGLTTAMLDYMIESMHQFLGGSR